MRPVLAQPGQGSAPPAQIAQFRADGFNATTGLRVQFFTEGFARAYGYPETRLINMISEATPLREERPYAPLVGLREVHYSRPGLASFIATGTGPVRGVYKGPPIFNSQTVIVSGTSAYDGTSFLGSMPGTDMVRFASSRNQMVAVAGGVAYLYDNTANTFHAITGTPLGQVIDVAYLHSRFVYALAGTDTFYWSAINDAANIGGLNFATAEAFPDYIAGLGVLNDELVIFGTSSVETWSTNADPNAPFAPVLGRGYQRGCASRDTTAFVDNALIWVGDDRVVYASRQSPARISSNAIEDKLRQCANIAGCTAWTGVFDGHELYVLNIPGVGSYAYDASRAGAGGGYTVANAAGRGEWSEWQSWGRTGFQGRCAFSYGGATFVGDDTIGMLWQLQAGVFTDGGAPLVRVASAFIKVEEGTPRCDNLVLHCVEGVGNPVDPGSAPIAEMRFSDDGGRTFSDWRSAPLGRQGAYALRASWRRLGQMRAPGRLVEVRVSDPVNAVFSHLELNAARSEN